jgi:hypothetical protein
MQQIASVLHDHQPITRAECISQLRRHESDAVTRERDALTGRKRFKPARAGGGYGST